MVISDKEAFRLLGLPLGVDRDAIQDRFKQMSNKLSASKIPDDRRKLEQVIAAFSQLIPQSERRNSHQNFNTNTSNRNKSLKDGLSNSVRNGHINNGNNDIEKDAKSNTKKAKKKKSKSKKKQVKSEDGSQSQNSYLSGGDRLAEADTEEDEEDEEETVEEGIDPNSAFVAMVGKKIGSSNNAAASQTQNNSNGTNTSTVRSDDNKKTKVNNKPNVVMLEARQIQSRQLAMRGNEEANNGEYKRAIHLFTEAIRLDPNDHRFFGNRSYCFGQLHQYVEALKDADKAIKLASEWPKGHFRRGRALKGLGKLLESEEAFKQVLRYDPGCEDAIQEINKVRKRRLVDMGFTELQAKAAIKRYGQVQPALDALLAGEFQSNLENVFFSDDDDCAQEEEEETVWQPPPKPKDEKMNPKNVKGLTSLWVGNVVPEVTEKMLIKLFSKFGHVTSVRQLKEKYCAFVNYSDKKWAGNAMESLQGYDLCGSKLLIKFPDNPIVNGSQNIILRKNKGFKT